MAYSNDYRKRTVEYKDTGHTFVELREAFKIPPLTTGSRNLPRDTMTGKSKGNASAR